MNEYVQAICELKCQTHNWRHTEKNLATHSFTVVVFFFFFFCRETFVLWYCSFFSPPSIYSKDWTQAFTSKPPQSVCFSHGLSLTHSFCLFSLSLWPTRLCINHAQTKTHLCKNMLWEGFRIFFDHYSSDSTSRPKRCSETFAIYFFWHWSPWF